MTELAQTADPSIEPVADDVGLVCPRCEYDLRGLPREGRCPECGDAIELAWIRREEDRARGLVPLQLANRRWLKMMMLGCVCLFVVGWMEMANAVLVVGQMVRMNFFFSIVTGLTGTVLMVLGLWLTGAREPAAGERRSNGKIVRYGIRAMAVLNLAIPLIGIKLINTKVDFMTSWKRLEMVTSVVGGVATFLLMWRLADAARRDGRKVLRRWLRVAQWVVPVAIIVETCTYAEIQMGKASYWLLSPHPLLGFVEVLVVVPVALARGVIHGIPLTVWTAQGLLSAGVLLLLLLAALMFRRAGSGERRMNLSRGFPVIPSGRE